MTPTQWTAVAVPPADDFDARASLGRELRHTAPRSEHALWAPSVDRPDPVALLEEQALSRVAALVPIRYGRMSVSPFAFYRGAAAIMASDLSRTPTSGIEVQLCGDAHLSNFGLFATPERKMIFDVNDFDETAPGPWEWDLKRLAASFEILGRTREFSPERRRAVTLAVTRGYRDRMRKSADSAVLTAWYDYIDAERIDEWIRDAAKAGGARQVERANEVISQARTRNSESVFAKLVRIVDGEPRIAASPPLIVPIEDLLPPGRERESIDAEMRKLIAAYRATLLAQHHPIADFTYQHMARKVVGVGSVGTRAWVVLLRGRDARDPLLLQAKEAQASVLEPYVGASAYPDHGQRVVMGQRMMQSSSDIFLGWQRTDGLDGVPRDYYVRQLHDWKGAVDVDVIRPAGALLYARLCGETLARAHARTGDRLAISGYIGTSDHLDIAIADFAGLYADQNQSDYDGFLAAIASGRLVTEPG